MIENIHVNSDSSNVEYVVTFKIENNLTTINCNCPASQYKYRSVCKHIKRLIKQEKTQTMTYQSQIEVLTKIINLIGQDKISLLFKELNEFEVELKKFKLLKTKLNKEFAIKLIAGF